ncbi:DNA translocase FtsK [Flavobacterium sp.]|uniref:DNA translocase FtsK n=1 Tax=Flavobacterium sp. TaxID=239 RepID=UPI003D6BDB75
MSIYKTYSNDQLENHLSQFLVSNWSYSSASAFARNPKAYEMQYIYGYRAKSSATTIAGQAYHKALEMYFAMMKQNEVLPDLVTLEQIAFDYIEDVDARDWKLQKTTPSIADCVTKATSTVSDLLINFLKDISVYTDDIEEILDVEYFGKNQFITLNGVDIPLPMSFRTDVVARLKSGKVVVIDHKSKGTYTNEADIKLAAGKQAITYAIGYESATGIKIDEVWFVENKYSQNRDKSPQLVKFIIPVSDINERRYFEAMLYESVRGLIYAVNDPDYIYIINDSDNLIDLAEIYEFWNKTLLSEIEDFDVDPSKKELISKRLKKIKDTGIKTINPNVIKQFRKKAAEFIQYDYSNKDMTQEEKIEHVLRGFGTIVKVAKKFNGYSSDTYLLSIDAGTKISSIQGHKLDLANALNVNTVRISQTLKVWEGRAYLAIEVSKKREKDLLFNKKDLVGYKIPIGKDNFDNIIYWDLENHSSPHALVCGSTGSGKSVELLSMVEYMKLAKIKDIIILDPKYEFTQMNISGVKVISDILEIEEFMISAVEEMNERVKKGGKHPFKTIIFDEFADAQAQARSGKELDLYENKEVGYYKLSTAAILAGAEPQAKVERVLVGQLKSLEENLRILLQKGRSVNYRICAATQRASAKIITGDAKANFPVQICFRVPKEIDSRVVLDEPGAESLAGMGDGLIKSPDYQELVRFQAYYKP